MTVYFLDTGDQLHIQRGCKVCAVTQQDIEQYQIVVSPRGVAHHSDEYGDTTCGKDATKSGWWWRS